MERRGYFHQKFGGQYIPESLMNVLAEIEGEHQFVAEDECFTRELDFFCNTYAGRKTPLYKARLLSKKYGPDIYIKREDLLPEGGSSFAAIAGQIIIGKRIGKKTVLIPAYNAQHGCIAAQLSAAMGLSCRVYVPENMVDTWQEEISRMKLYQAAIINVPGDFEEAYQAACEYWVPNAPQMILIQTRAAGPHPYPMMVEEYQKVIGVEIREQMKECCGKLPDLMVAAVGEDAAAAGAFYPFETEKVKLLAAESSEYPVLAQGEDGAAQGMRSLFIQDDDGNFISGTTVSGKLYPIGAEPQLAAWYTTGRMQVVTVTRQEAIAAAQELASIEGVLPGENSAYAVAAALKAAPAYGLEDNLVVVLSGKADKNWIEICMERR